MQKAFVLGAGLGTRLKSLTATLPKPLIPFFQRPLITFAFDHLIDLGIEKFIVNTHHLPEQYAAAFPEGAYRNRAITFRHEPILLETAGGIGNVADLLDDETAVVYNGDILTDLPLRSAFETHKATGNAVTLVLRDSGDQRHIAWDPTTGKVTDIRNLLKTGDAGAFQFTGIYFIEPEFVRRIAPGVKMSVIPHFLDLIREGERLGGVVANYGQWWDLGDRRSYLDAHHAVRRVERFPGYASDDLSSQWRRAVHEGAETAPGAEINDSVIGRGAIVESGATVNQSILWPGARVAAGARLTRCIVRTGQTAEGTLTDRDV